MRGPRAEANTSPLFFAPSCAVWATATDAFLGREQGWKVAQNVVNGVAGFVVPILWFGMDWQGTASKEVQALAGSPAIFGSLGRAKALRGTTPNREALKNFEAKPPAAPSLVSALTKSPKVYCSSESFQGSSILWLISISP